MKPGKFNCPSCGKELEYDVMNLKWRTLIIYKHLRTCDPKAAENLEEFIYQVADWVGTGRLDNNKFIKSIIAGNPERGKTNNIEKIKHDHEVKA